MQEFFELACKLLAEQLEIDPADAEKSSPP